MLIDDYKNFDKRNYNIYNPPLSSPRNKDKMNVKLWAYWAAQQYQAKGESYYSLWNSGEEFDTMSPYQNFIDYMYNHYAGGWKGENIDFILKQAGGDNVLPARLINYPILKNKVDNLVGEFLDLPLKLNCVAISDEVIEKKTRLRSDMMFKKLMMPFIEQQEKLTGATLEREKFVAKDIDKYTRLSHKQIEEINMSKLMKYQFHQHSWQNEFAEAYKDILRLGFAFMDWDEINFIDGKWSSRDPRNVLFDWGCKSMYGLDAMFYGIKDNVTMDYLISSHTIDSTIIDELDRTMSNFKSGGTSSGYNNRGPQTGIGRTVMYFKTFTMRYAKVSTNKYGDIDYKLLPQGEKPSKRDSEIIQLPLGEWWKTVTLEDKVLVHAEPIFQPREEDTPQESSPPFKVFLFNRVNGKPIGLMEPIVGLQELFAEILFKIELELATSPGSVIDYDISTKPKNIDYSEIFYHMQSKKLLVTNKSKLGANGGSGTRQYDLSPKGLDMMINLLMFIENVIDVMTGVNKYRQGDVGDQYVGAIRSAIKQSSLTTKPYLNFFEEGIRQSFKHAAAALKYRNWNKPRKLTMLLGEAGAEFFTLDDTYPWVSYDFFFNDGKADEQKKEMLFGLAGQAIQAGQATFRELLPIIKKDSLEEIYADMERISDEFAEKTQKIREQEMILADREKQMDMADKEAERENERRIVDAKNEKDIHVAETYVTEGIKKLLLEFQLNLEGKMRDLEAAVLKQNQSNN
jgi:hypothetical protein